MRALIASTSGAGHLGPLLPFADALPRGAATRSCDSSAIRRPPASGNRSPGSLARRAGDTSPTASGSGGGASRRCCRPSRSSCDEWRAGPRPARGGGVRVGDRRRAPRDRARARSRSRRPPSSGARSTSPRPSCPPGVAAALRASPYLSRFPASLDPSPYADTRRYAARTAGRKHARARLRDVRQPRRRARLRPVSRRAGRGRRARCRGPASPPAPTSTSGRRPGERPGRAVGAAGAKRSRAPRWSSATAARAPSSARSPRTSR